MFQVWLSKVPRPQRIRNQSIGFEVQKQVSWMLGSCQSHWFSILRFWLCLWHMPICYFFWHGQNDARYRLFLVRGTHFCIFNPNWQQIVCWIMSSVCASLVAQLGRAPDNLECCSGPCCGFDFRLRPIWKKYFWWGTKNTVTDLCVTEFVSKFYPQQHTE